MLVSGTSRHVWYHSSVWIGGVGAHRRFTFVLVKSSVVNDILTLGSLQCTLQKIILSPLASFTLGQASRAALLVLLQVMLSVLSVIQCVAFTYSLPSC
jgi:hypothetical protein